MNAAGGLHCNRRVTCFFQCTSLGCMAASAAYFDTTAQIHVDSITPSHPRFRLDTSAKAMLTLSLTEMDRHEPALTAPLMANSGKEAGACDAASCNADSIMEWLHGCA